MKSKCKRFLIFFFDSSNLKLRNFATNPLNGPIALLAPKAGAVDESDDELVVGGAVGGAVGDDNDDEATSMAMLGAFPVPFEAVVVVVVGA